MVRHHQPRKGSVAFSPRKRAAKETPRVKSWPQMDEPKLLGLAGYKVGMTHALVTDTDKNSPTNGMEVFTPVTVLEVPPVVVMGIRAYEKTSRGLKVITEVLADNLDQELSRKIYKKKDVFFIGRLNDFATAAEGSLKMKEISYINSQSYPAGELKHGTISLIEEGTIVVAVAGKSKVFSKTVSNISEVQARGAEVILITDESEKNSKVTAEISVTVPETLKEFQNSLLVLPLQLLSYYTAKNLGCDIDRPKNLAKSVTVE